MGQGQADIALQKLSECSRNGEWLCLKNLHLVTAWLPVLEKVSTTYLEKKVIVKISYCYPHRKGGWFAASFLGFLCVLLFSLLQN